MFYWLRFSSPVKRHFRPSNPQLTPPTLQIQYCYSLSLRFNNVKVPTNRKVEIIQPVDTDSIVLGICNKDLGFKLDIHHIGRSHPIGEPKDGKTSIITRFVTYRQRQLVFGNKEKLKGNHTKCSLQRT